MELRSSCEPLGLREFNVQLLVGVTGKTLDGQLIFFFFF